MERLTKISELGDAYYPKCFEKPCCGMGECVDGDCELLYEACKKLAEYEDIGTPEELKELKENGAFTGVELAQIAAMQKELKKYKDLEEQGLLVRLPCKVGDTVYKVNKASKKISEHKILKFEIDVQDITGFTMQIWFENYDSCFLHHFGKTVFLTREEAEKKLEEMRK